MLQFATEFLGTFFFLSVIIATGQAVPIGIALAAAIFFGGEVSGGHFNPAVTTMMFAKGDLGLEKFIGYIVAQVLGGLCALMFFSYTPAGLKLKGRK